MRIVDRYLVRGFLYPLVYCVILFSVLFIIIDSFDNLSDFLKYNVPPGVIASYYGYLFPALFVQMLPVAALVSILYVLGNLTRRNEITAMKASGISSFAILSPYLFMGILLSFLVLLINETVVPRATLTSTAIMEGLIQKGRHNMDERAIKDVTLYGEGNRIIFAKEYEIISQTLYDVNIIEDTPEKIVRSKLTAEKARYENEEWVFYGVVAYDLSADGEIIGEPFYSDRRPIDLAEKPEDFLREASQVEYMSAKQLRQYIEKLEGSSKKLSKRLWVDFHNKVAFPFVCFIVMLIGAPLAMKTERGSAMVGIGMSLIVVLLYYAIDSVCLAMGKGGHLPPFVAAWAGNLLFAAVGIYLIRKTA